MSAFKDAARADLAAVFLNTSEFAESATFLPDGKEGGFELDVVMGDVDQEFIEAETGVAQDRQAQALVSRAVVLAGAHRMPRKGDRLCFPADAAYAGEWTVMQAEDDNLGGVLMRVRQARPFNAGGKNTVRT